MQLQNFAAAELVKINIQPCSCYAHFILSSYVPAVRPQSYWPVKHNAEIFLFPHFSMKKTTTTKNRKIKDFFKVLRKIFESNFKCKVNLKKGSEVYGGLWFCTFVSTKTLWFYKLFSVFQWLLNIFVIFMLAADLMTKGLAEDWYLIYPTCSQSKPAFGFPFSPSAGSCFDRNVWWSLLRFQTSSFFPRREQTGDIIWK